MEVKLRNLVEESTFNNNAQLLEDQNLELANLRLELLQQEEKQQDIQSKFDNFEDKIKKLEELKAKDKQIIEDQNYELTLLMEKLRKAEKSKESTLERVRAEITSQPQEEALIKQLEEKCNSFSKSGLHFKSESIYEREKIILGSKALVFERG